MVDWSPENGRLPAPPPKMVSRGNRSEFLRPPLCSTTWRASSQKFEKAPPPSGYGSKTEGNSSRTSPGHRGPGALSSLPSLVRSAPRCDSGAAGGGRVGLSGGGPESRGGLQAIQSGVPGGCPEGLQVGPEGHAAKGHDPYEVESLSGRK